MTELVLGLATPMDASWMALLARNSFDPALHPYMVSTQSGTDAWWRVVVEHPRSFPGACFLVARTAGGERVGFAEFTRAGGDPDSDTGFLSYVCVVPEARGHGVARRLIAEYIRRTAVRHLELDVFTDNESARRLYDGMGFEQVRAATWWTGPVNTHKPTVPARFDNLHASMARHRVYGFCELAGTHEGREFRLGVLGDRTLRCSTSADLVDPVLHAIALSVVPTLDRAVVVLPAECQSPDGRVTIVNSSLRLRASDIAERMRV